MSNGVEYGAVIYSFRVAFWTYYFVGETYKGFQTTNWYTVINGLGAGYLVGTALKKAGNFFWPITSLQIIGFAHTHPIGNSNSPSGPDSLMKGIGFIIGARVFPIAVYNNNIVSIKYF